MRLVLNFSRLLSLTALTLLLAAPRPASAQTNLLVNGSFEDTRTDSLQSLVTESLAAGSTRVEGWTVVGAEAAWVKYGDFTIFPSDGSRAMDLTGYHDALPYAGMRQTVATTGASDRLSFDLGSIIGGNHVTLRAFAGSQSQDFLSLHGPDAAQEWESFRFDFVATSTTTGITLQGLSSLSGNNIGLDNARVERVGADANAVPEPVSLALFAPGLAVVGS